jgi:hypothetical protein
MAFQTINIGTTVNDGTGDTLRDGGDKINDNFAVAVEGPALTVTTNRFVLWDGTTGRLVKQGALTESTVVPQDSATGAATLPVGTDAQRPTPAAGMVRLNTDSDKFEGYDGVAWGALGGSTTGFKLFGTIYYTTSGTFSKGDPFGGGDIGLRAIRVRAVGGGGGGGGAATTSAGQTACGGGGGGGGYAEAFITNIADLASSVTVTCGAGGTGATAGNNSGAEGGSSSFGTSVVANGGNFGLGQAAGSPLPRFSASSGAGGTGVTGDLLVQGSRPIVMLALASGNMRAPGGDSFLGFGAVSGSATSGGNGAAGQLYGGGGSGGGNSENQGTARSGGAGANGIVIVDCFV